MSHSLISCLLFPVRNTCAHNDKFKTMDIWFYDGAKLDSSAIIDSAGPDLIHARCRLRSTDPASLWNYSRYFIFLCHSKLRATIDGKTASVVLMHELV